MDPTQVLAALAIAAASPQLVWAERRTKAWAQRRRGPHPLQIYRDLRRLLAKSPLVPDTASTLFRAAPALCLAATGTALLTLPLSGPATGIAPAAGLLVLALLLALHRFLLAAQAYDTATPFAGIGASRELFLGGIGEPVLLTATAAIFLATGSAAVPDRPLALSDASTWLLLLALTVAFVAEAARIPIDNPATHLELTMVHEALILETSGWILALHELAAAIKQATIAMLVILLAVPLPAHTLPRVALLVALAVAFSALVAVAESGMAKLRLFRASHLSIMAAFLAFLAAGATLARGVIP